MRGWRASGGSRREVGWPSTRFLLPLAAAMMAACSMSDGPIGDAAVALDSTPLDSASDATPEPDSAPEPQFVSFTFEHSFGPCPEGMVCMRRMTIQDTGEVHWNDQGTLYDDVLTMPELDRVATTATDPVVLAAIREPRSTDCLDVTDNWENVQIVLASRPPLDKDIAGCSGEPYWQIRGLVDDLIAAHF